MLLEVFKSIITIISFCWSLFSSFLTPFLKICSCFLCLFDWTELECLDFSTLLIHPTMIGNWMHLENSTLSYKVYKSICSRVEACKKDMLLVYSFFSCCWLYFKAKGDRFDKLRFHFWRHSLITYLLVGNINSKYYKLERWVVDRI